MIILIVIGCIFLLVGLCFFAWLIMHLFRTMYRIRSKKERLEDKNPYIFTQKKIDQNNLDYQNYIAWMHRNGGDIPLQKMMTKEEHDILYKIKTL